jgi:CheY-like chemotaxis protein
MNSLFRSATLSSFSGAFKMNMLRILLVEPDAAVSGVLGEVLTQEFAADVSCAARGKAASRALRNTPWDLAVIEAMLPDMTGFELAKVAADNHVPGLLIAGHPQAQERCRSLGYPHLDKPFSLRALQAAATSVLLDAPRNVERLHEAYGRLALSSLEARRTIEVAHPTRDGSRQGRLAGCELPGVRVAAKLPGERDGGCDDGSSLPIDVFAALENISRFRGLAQWEGLDEQTRQTIRCFSGKTNG